MTEVCENSGNMEVCGLPTWFLYSFKLIYALALGYNYDNTIFVTKCFWIK